MQRPLSTAEARRRAVVDAAVIAFAERGRRATVAEVAVQAGISPAYVFKLFPRKEALFAAAIDSVHARILDVLGAGARRAADQSPDAVLAAMRIAYSGLLQEPDVLRLLVHAQSAIAVPEVGAAYRRGLASVTEFVFSRSGAREADVQDFIAFAQLSQLIATLGITEANEHWTRVLTRGLDLPASA
jgi:AcrR family transcriptional regulator